MSADRTEARTAAAARAWQAARAAARGDREVLEELRARRRARLEELPSELELPPGHYHDPGRWALATGPVEREADRLETFLSLQDATHAAGEALLFAGREPFLLWDLDAELGAPAYRPRELRVIVSWPKELEGPQSPPGGAFLPVAYAARDPHAERLRELTERERRGRLCEQAAAELEALRAREER